MLDIQGLSDSRDIPLQKVGVKGLRYPIEVLDKLKGSQSTVARADLFVNLPKEFKGTHMSRFIENFQRHRNKLGMPYFLHMLQEICQDLDAESAYGSIDFPYFLNKKAPVSGLESVMSYECRYEGSVHKNDKDAFNSDFIVQVGVPVHTLCPCSKAISKHGAHNQRGLLIIRLELGPFFWIEDIIDIAEKAASSPLYSLLKREDEKYVTEQAWENPKFVEDLVRDVYIGIEALGHFPWFSVEAENMESIHNHSAFAYVEYGSRSQGAKSIL